MCHDTNVSSRRRSRTGSVPVRTIATSDDDRALAYDLFCKAADAGNSEAMFHKAVMLRNSIGVTRSIPKAVACMYHDGKGVESVQTAGCTIYVTGFVKAASKI